jgi:hypothetical protein
MQNLFRIVLRVLLCLLVMAPQVIRGQTKEYQVKAAFLFNFVQFVEWPDRAYADTNAPFCIGVLGDDPFGAALDEIVQGESIGNHKLTIQRSQRASDLKNCQMIFISKSKRGQMPEILAALGSRPILTVSEVEGFAPGGGAIGFYLDGSKVRFEINPGAAEREGLKISSQLLTVGKIVATTREAP